MRITRFTTTAAAACALALTLAACGSDDDSGGDAGSPEDVEAALEEGGKLTVWAWSGTITEAAEAFDEAHDNITVEVVNAGTNQDQYTALQNAIDAGKGVPDVAQIEYYALPQYAIGESVTDLSSFGANELEGTFTPGTWNAVHPGGSEGIYGLPVDSGPMAMFYNKKVFDEAGIEVPTTWEEYVQAAHDLHEANPDSYIAGDVGDAGFTTSMIWAAGGKPYQIDGTNVTIDFADEGSQRFADTWQELIDEGLVADIEGWTDEWYQALGDGTIATLVTGAWMPPNFESGVANASGDWRVAPMPQWEDGGELATAENGGSSLALLEASEKDALAYAFIEYMTTGEGSQLMHDLGSFPADTATLESEEFLNKEFEYFGGQKANEILSEAAASVIDGWSYLPYQVYANSIFNDTVGQAYVSGTTLAEGLQDWQDQSVEYGNDQGFTVNQ
jgi:multiple sugar transport system substrate-binding protein